MLRSVGAPRIRAQPRQASLFLSPLALRGETRLNLCAAPVLKAPPTIATTACNLPAHLASCLALAGTGAPITSRQQHDLSFSSMSIAIGAPHACALLSLLACRTLYGGICSPVMPVLTCHHLLPGCLTLTRRKALLIISTACCCSQTWLATSSPLCLRIFASLFADACSPRDCRCPRFSRLTSLHTRRPYLCQHRCFLTPPPNDPGMSVNCLSFYHSDAARAHAI